MNQDEVLSGRAGQEGIDWILNGQSSRRSLKREVQTMLREGYRAGPFHLTRAKFKPERKLSAYFTFPAIDPDGQASHLVQLAVTWQKTLGGAEHADARRQMQEEADQAGLMPVQCELWKDLPGQGMRLQIWPLDPEFPHLVRLGNAVYADNLFKSLGITSGKGDTPVVTPIRYRPGERHVLRYDISSPEDASGLARRFYAKLYESVQDAERAFGVANRVVDWLASNESGIQGIRPAAMSQTESVILYPHAPGTPLSRQLKRSRRWLAAQLHTVGKGLATLHNGPESLQADLKQNSFSREVKAVKRASEQIQILLPETYETIIETLDRAEEKYAQLPQEQPTFTHADFKSDHLLTTPQGLTLIDFDTCTLTDPALDVGKFLADLEWWFTLQGISNVESAQAEVLKGYSATKESDQRVQERLKRAKLFHVLILTKIVARRVPVFKKEWAERTRSLIGRASELLQEALKT